LSTTRNSQVHYYNEYLNKGRITYLIHRSWEIEKKFESVSTWKGFTTIGFSHRKLLLTLARDSQKHRLDLETILRKLSLEQLHLKLKTNNLILMD